MTDDYHATLKSIAALVIGGWIIVELGIRFGWWIDGLIAIAGVGLVAHDLWQLRAGWWRQ